MLEFELACALVYLLAKYRERKEQIQMLAKRKKAYTHDVVVMDTAKDVIQPKI